MSGSIAKYGPDGWARGADTATIRKLGGTGEVLAQLSYIPERSADPDAPPEGHYTIWMSDGTESGDDGDIMCIITAGGITKIFTLVDFSGGIYGGDVVIQMNALVLASSAPKAHTQPVNMKAAQLASSAPSVDTVLADVTVAMNAASFASSAKTLGVNPLTKVTLPYRSIVVAAPAVSYAGAASTVTMDTLSVTGSAPDAVVIQHAAAMDALSAIMSAPSLTVVVADLGIDMDAAQAAVSAPKLTVYAPGPGSTQIFYDSFTDTPGTQLQSHTSDSSHSWTRVGGTGNIVINPGGTNITPSGLSGYLQYTADPGEHVRQLRIHWYSGNQFYNLRVMFRVKDNDDYLCINMYCFGNDFDIQKCVTGGFTNLATSSPTLAAATWYTMWIEDNPSTDEIKVYHATKGSSKPGSAQVSVTDSTWSGETGIGVRPQNNSDYYDELECWSTVYE